MLTYQTSFGNNNGSPLYGNGSFHDTIDMVGEPSIGLGELRSVGEQGASFREIRPSGDDWDALARSCWWVPGSVETGADDRVGAVRVGGFGSTSTSLLGTFW